MSTHPLQFARTFSRREPALRAMEIPYTLSSDSKDITFDRELSAFSPHERDVVEFAINPLVSLKIFGGLDAEVAKAIAQSIKQTYLDGDGNW